MATRRTEMSPVGKEKRGISPLNTAKPRGRSPTTKSTCTASEKHIPNYLKPTISSNSSSSTSDKPKHTRRVSFEKTPSPSRTQRSRVVSPGPSHGKPALKPSSTKDAGKHHSLYARPVASAIKNKSVKKQETTSPTKQEIIPLNTIEEVEIPEPEIKPEYQEFSVTQAEEQDGSENENKIEKGSEYLVKEDPQEKTITGQTEAEIGNQDAKIVNTEFSTVLEHADASIGIKTEEEKEILQIEETSIKQEELEEHTKNEEQKELEENSIDETVAEKPNDEIEKKIEEEKNEELHKKEKEIEAHKEIEVVEEEKQYGSGNEGHESKETEAVEQEGSGTEAHQAKETKFVEENKEEEAHESEESKVVEAASEATKQQHAQGNEDSAVSNNTTGETANKLNEERKNKVKALAGAFESVMQ